MQYILRTRSGDYVGEGGTFNSQRDYAKRFSSEEEGRAYVQANRMYAEFTSETLLQPRIVPHDETHGNSER